MKIVKVEINYSFKVYEYQTDLDLEVGKTYRLTNVEGGWQPRQRVRVLSVSDSADYAGTLGTILAADEEEAF